MSDGQAALTSLFESELLRGLPETAVRDFLDRATLARFAASTPLFREGDSVERLMFVVTGRVKITRRSEAGRENILVIAGPGAAIGSIAIFEPGRQRTSGIALGQVDAAWLTNAAMREWLATHNAAALRFIQLLIRRTEHQNDTLHDVFGIDVGTRVARALLREADRFGRATPVGRRLSLGLNQEEFALHVRASRESVNQALATFVRMGWIRRDGTEFILLNEEALLRQAGSLQ